MSKPQTQPPSPADGTARMRSLTRRGFLVGGGVAAAGAGGFAWLINQPAEDGLPWPLRRALEFNQRLTAGVFGERGEAKTFSPALAVMPRVNGHVGLSEKIDLNQWRLQVEAAHLPRPLSLTLDEIRALPRSETITEFKCVEGWSVIVQFAGARLSDFANRYQLAARSGRPADLRNQPNDAYRYVGLVTPDRVYQVGLDMASALHPQTLLCYEMNGRPLTPDHGAPLRLAIPLKYGYKSLKRIGTIHFSDQRPDDYWASRGYDYYAGH